MEPLMADHLSFGIARTQLARRILIPKYYDPELAEYADLASVNFELPKLGDLLVPGGSRLGTWIPREHYGTGPVPYVRTSDLNNWRIRPDFKKGVAQEVFAQVAKRQDVRSGDVLMVAHGTYLIGAVAIVTEDDMPLVIQDHVFRLRLDEALGVDQYLLLAALSTRFVRRQVRAKQFSADIIDKIGERHLEIQVPIPRNRNMCAAISREVSAIIEEQNSTRRRISALLQSDMRMTRERAEGRHAFSIKRSAVTKRILIPKYYDPILRKDLESEIRRTGTKWVPLGLLVNEKLISVSTGVEVGKMAYGTGPIPFIRTTDIADLKVKSDPRQGIAKEIHDDNAEKAAVREGDVLVVRDGTYLVGSSAIVTREDEPALICGGIYRLRAIDRDLNQNILLGLLNLPVVRRQMRAKQFTRDVIDTLGKRIFEVLIPEPASEIAQAIGMEMSEIIAQRQQIAGRMAEVVSQLEPTVPSKSTTRPGWSMRA
jgi:hypothetical protein